jgi:hypothetical protein
MSFGLSCQRSRVRVPSLALRGVPAAAGISSFRGRLRAPPRASGVALWSSARAISSAVSGRPSGRVVERRDRRDEPIAEEDPAASDPPRGQIPATCELVHGGARNAEQVGHLPGRQDIGTCQRARGRRSHLPKRGPEPAKRTPGGPTSAGPLGLRHAEGQSAREVICGPTKRALSLRAFATTLAVWMGAVMSGLEVRLRPAAS